MKERLSFLPMLFLSFLLNAQSINQADWQQQVSYQINVTLNDEQHTLEGRITLIYRNNSPDSLTELYMHIWPNAYSSDSTAFAKQQVGNGKLDFHFSDEDERGYIKGLNFKTEGRAMKWTYHKKHRDIAIISLDKPLLPGEQLMLSTDFMVKLPEVFSRLGHEGQDYFISQWYPKPAVYDVNGWNPMPYLDQGEFYSEFGDFTVNISLPQNYVVAATGTLETASEKEFREERIKHPLKLPKDSVPASAETYKTITFKADSVHDFAWFASKKFNIDRSHVLINERKVATYVFAYEVKPPYSNAIATALNYYSENVGPYPYEHATVVKGELKAGGGMEYPMITLCDVMTDEVIIHEVGHNWFYGILASNERRYPWMDESINSFFDNSALKHESGSSSGKFENMLFAVAYKDEILRKEHQPIGGPSEEFTYKNYGVVVYGIGPQVFNHLKSYLGDEVFKTAMQRYYNTWKFRHPLPGDMKDVFEEVSGEDLSWFFNDIIASDKVLDYGLVMRDKKVYLVNYGEINAPIPVVYPVKGLAFTRWYRVVPGEELLLDANANPSELRIDPKLLTTDYFPSNDAISNKPALKPFTGKDKKGIQEIYYLPAIGWNGYDKTMLGIMLHNYSYSDKTFQFHLAPLYGLETQTLTGFSKFTFSKAGKAPGGGVDFEFEAKRFTWSQNNFRNYHYTKFQPSITYRLPRPDYRSKKFREFKLSYARIEFKEAFDLEKDRKESFNPGYQGMAPWNFIVASYKKENKRALNPYSFQIELENALTNTKTYMGRRDTLIENSDTSISFPLTGTQLNKSFHSKLTFIFDYKLDIGIKNKPLEIRLYTSYFLSSPEDGYFNHTISNTGMRRDYRFDEFAMFRNADEGVFQNQISGSREFSRFIGLLGQSDKLLANMILTIPLPGKIPLKPYIELLTYTDIDKEFFNKSESSFIYNIGIEAVVIPDFFSIYLNLAQSPDVTNWQENSFQGIDTFVERITFRLNLNGLNPPEVKRNIKLF